MLDEAMETLPDTGSETEPDDEVASPASQPDESGDRAVAASSDSQPAAAAANGGAAEVPAQSKSREIVVCDCCRYQR